MLGLQQYLSELNSIGSDTNFVVTTEMDKIRSTFQSNKCTNGDPLDDYTKRKYLWKLVVSEFYLSGKINPSNPLGLDQCLELFQNYSIVDKDCCWNAINVIYSNVLNENQWLDILDVVIRDFTNGSDDLLLERNLIGLSNNIKFIPMSDKIIDKLEKVFNIIYFQFLGIIYNKQVITLIDRIIQLTKLKFIEEETPFLNKMLSFLKECPIQVSALITTLYDINSQIFTNYSNQLLEYYLFISNQLTSNPSEDLGCQLSKFLQMLYHIGVEKDDKSFIKLTLSVIDQIDQNSFLNDSSTSKDDKYLFGSIYINCFKLLSKIDSQNLSYIDKLCTSLEANFKTQGSIFMNIPFKLELFKVLEMNINSSSNDEELKLRKINTVLKFGKMLKRLLHTKNELISDKLESILVNFTESPLDFQDSKIILVILFDKFIRIEKDKSKLLSLILKVMYNRIDSGIVKYSILKLIKCWISLGNQVGETDSWLKAFKLVEYCTATADEEVIKLRSDILEFICHGLNSIPDNKLNENLSFVLLSISILKLNITNWHLGNYHSQIKLVIRIYPLVPSEIQEIILSTFVDYYPYILPQYQLTIMELLKQLSLKEDGYELKKTSLDCINLINGSIRFLKFNQGILLDNEYYKITFKCQQMPGNVIHLTFNMVITGSSNGSLSIEGDTSGWSIINQETNSSGNKIKYDFDIEIRSIYPYQNEPQLKISASATIQIPILLKLLVNSNSSMPVQTFDQRWFQVKSTFDAHGYKKLIIPRPLSPATLERTVKRLGFDVLEGTLNAISLIKLNDSIVGVMVKISPAGDETQLELICTQIGVVDNVMERLQLALISE